MKRERLQQTADYCASAVVRDVLIAVLADNPKKILEIDMSESSKKYRVMCLRNTGWYVRYDGLESREDARTLVQHCVREGAKISHVMAVEVIE